MVPGQILSIKLRITFKINFEAKVLGRGLKQRCNVAFNANI
jgi:hypothetical protein